MNKTIHRAKYVMAEAGSLLSNAAVHVSAAGRILRVEPWQGKPPDAGVSVIDWGTALIMPGLVNAHTHLELGFLDRRLDRTAEFTHWLAQLINKRQAVDDARLAESVREGALQRLSSGTTLVGDISSAGVSRPALKPSLVRRVVFEEALFLAPERAAEVMGPLKLRLEAAEPGGLTECGISPHAPYSVSPELYRLTAALARERRIPLATHVAETRSEQEFLRNGAGRRSFYVA